MNELNVLAVSLPASLVHSIADLADAEGVSFNEVLRRAIKARTAHVRATDEWAADRLDQLAGKRNGLVRR